MIKDKPTPENWVVSKKHILKSIEKMTPNYNQNDKKGSIHNVNAFIKNEQYALATEELMLIGKMNFFSKEFWQSLHLAAKAIDFKKFNQELLQKS